MVSFWTECNASLIMQGNTYLCLFWARTNQGKVQIQRKHKKRGHMFKLWAIAIHTEGCWCKAFKMQLLRNCFDLKGLVFAFNVYSTSFVISILSSLLNIDNRSHVIVLVYFSRFVRPPDTMFVFCFLNIYKKTSPRHCLADC